MHIMIATDGSLDATSTAEFAGHLAQPDDRLSVVTVVEIPRSLLSSLRAFYERRELVQGTGTDDEYVSSTSVTTVSPSWPGDDALLAAFVNEQKADRTQPLVDEFAKRGFTATAISVEGADPTRPLLDFIEQNGVDLLLIGSRGMGMFEGLLGSTSTRLARRAPCPVLLLRA
jgi:nucleotide-binding universal stress UspA family protein